MIKNVCLGELQRDRIRLREIGCKIKAGREKSFKPSDIRHGTVVFGLFCLVLALLCFSILLLSLSFGVDNVYSVPLYIEVCDLLFEFTRV